MNEIFWQAKALKQLRKIDAQHNAMIRRAVNTELVDLGAVRIVSIEELKKRDERTY